MIGDGDREEEGRISRMKGVCRAADTFPDIYPRAGGQAFVLCVPVRREFRDRKR